METPRARTITAGAQKAASSQPDLTGKRLGDYHLLRRLGRGGMADVYLAEQSSLRRQVAIKVLWEQLATDESYVRRFHREGQAVAALESPHIVRIHEVGYIDGVHFLAQEYVAGRNLRQHLTRTGPLPAGTAVSVLRQVAAALSAAAESGVVHRDIKPENILLSTNGEVKVADFGLARRAGEEQLELTQVGNTLGTPLYMSPEQAEGGQLDERSDLYSLGVTAYQMLAGHPPFTGETALAVAVQHLLAPPPRLENARPDIAPALCQVVHRLLAKSPRDRFQSAAELGEALRTVPVEAAGEGPGRAVASPKTAEARAALIGASRELQALTERNRSHQLGWIGFTVWPLVFALALALGGLAAWLSRPANRPALLAGRLPPIPRQSTAEAQFDFAMRHGGERAMRSVEIYFPASASSENEFYLHKARLQLAYLSEETGRTDEALRLYGDLAQSDAGRELRAIGLIGQANLLAARGERASSNRKLFQLAELLVEGGSLPRQRQQDLLRRLTPGLRADFQRQLSRPRRGVP